MLEDFLAVYDELNDNIDMYVGRKDDIRKPLKRSSRRHRIPGEATGAEDSANSMPTREAYEFLLTDALDTVDSSARTTARPLRVEEYMKHQKKK